MSEITLQIDGKEVVATKGMTILEAAQKAGIAIPTLCHYREIGTRTGRAAFARWK